MTGGRSGLNLQEAGRAERRPATPRFSILFSKPEDKAILIGKVKQKRNHRM